MKRQLSFALHAAVEGCTSTNTIPTHIACINLLLQNDASIDGEKHGKTILMVAAAKGFLELVHEIVELDADINYADQNNMTALHYAIDNKAENLDVVSLLLDKDARVNGQSAIEGRTPLMLAVQRGHVEIARALI